MRFSVIRIRQAFDFSMKYKLREAYAMAGKSFRVSLIKCIFTLNLVQCSVDCGSAAFYRLPQQSGEALAVKQPQAVWSAQLWPRQCVSKQERGHGIQYPDTGRLCGLGLRAANPQYRFVSFADRIVQSVLYEVDR